jgi:oxalate---CoA ligase
LARDCYAIIKARCRECKRLEFGAFEQVFPNLNRNSVRQRTVILREVPGSEAYMNRLEARFYELWCQYRGTDVLPDDNPTSPTDFELVKHVEFLRRYIDKQSLLGLYI